MDLTAEYSTDLKRKRFENSLEGFNYKLRLNRLPLQKVTILDLLWCGTIVFERGKCYFKFTFLKPKMKLFFLQPFAVAIGLICDPPI